jgi:hypothetical protein
MIPKATFKLRDGKKGILILFIKLPMIASPFFTHTTDCTLKVCLGACKAASISLFSLTITSALGIGCYYL